MVWRINIRRYERGAALPRSQLSRYLTNVIRGHDSDLRARGRHVGGSCAQ